ncbi:MAG TPA: hypothetical protein P5294_04575 [Smithellaceae bacterium]|nr:hypothetical protein [Smithellaceae bacterium]HRS88776.1 hypothetical protein [Smithellaceae bacterium]HRV25787.1 hypothetical protein [Smithellaceae bacterium]
MPNLVFILMIAGGVLSLIFFIFTFVAVKNRKIIGSTVSLLAALLFLALAALAGTITVATKGYVALTHEETAATVTTTPMGGKVFLANFEFPDGRKASFRLAGDAIYVDAHILKWKPLVNILGLHTTYELDRVAGRYMDIEEEVKNTRTVFLLAEKKPVNMFDLRTRFAFLEPFLDAEYGSAVFVELKKPAKFEVKVSTTGLLIREIES